ncbi:hypothetical protein BEP19_11460 [Ammoniphilus oxalaticus]|uniref:Uncharacterized protein n=1 Tax=Ammoniphilus oxalaticus TaxID=66863 RepID=A0A419SGD0_9BACL|nr:hypothetical protein [Ammoniphilus oxalaticus]RKD22852.1 hypothetical protein BEP19_11460 [Ammoniphilus oxalaticus]
MRKNRWLLILLLISLGALVSYVEAAERLNIEVFDVETKQVTNTTANSEIVQKELGNSLTKITGLTKEFDPIPTKGQMIKIPLEPSVTVNNEWVTTFINELILILPTGSKPLLMIFDDENKPYFFEFDYDLQLLKSEIEQSLS